MYAGTQDCVDSHAATSASGEDPGATTRPYSAYAELSGPSANTTPAARNIQPMRLSGRRDVISQPTIGKLAPRISVATPFESSVTSVAAVSRTKRTPAATSIASARSATVVATAREARVVTADDQRP